MDLSNRIINHLKSRGNRHTDLNEILIAMYEEELKGIKVLSDKVLKVLAELKVNGIIKEYFDQDGKLCYGLSNNDSKKIKSGYSQ